MGNSSACSVKTRDAKGAGGKAKGSKRSRGDGPCSACIPEKGRHHVGEGVVGTSDHATRAPNLTRSDIAVHMIIIALDYKNTKQPLTSTVDGRNMEELARASGVNDVRTLYDEQATIENVERLVKDTGSACGPDDYFVFYFAGHGTNMSDETGDEEDGEDEAFCFVTPDGSICNESTMTDDTFAELLQKAIPKKTHILILTDCCHSGSIADLTKEAWDRRRAGSMSISGCLDDQESGDIGKGGIFTQSMLLAIDKLRRKGQLDFSVGKLFNAILREDEKTFNATQTISIHYSRTLEPKDLAWPLVPIGLYEAPLRKAQASGALRNAQITFRGVDDDTGVPDDLTAWAKANGVDLDGDLSDPELEDGWKPYKKRADEITEALEDED